MHPPDWNRAFAAFRYEFPLDVLIHRYKFARDPCAGRVLAEAMVAEIATRRPRLPQALVPVPMHWWRQQRRGFNQALELAQAIGAAMGAPVLASALQRRRHTRVQRGLSAADRRQNLRGVIVPGHERPPPRVALIDDVMTTGATLTACAQPLRASGVETLDVWVAARVPRF